jgi:hypothetical protein
LTVPILSIPCRKKKSSPPKPPIYIPTIITYKLNSMFVITLPLPSAKLIAWRTRPVASDLTIAILAGLALDVRCLLMLFSTVYMSIDATIMTLPALN